MLKLGLRQSFLLGSWKPFTLTSLSFPDFLHCFRLKVFLQTGFVNFLYYLSGGN